MIWKRTIVLLILSVLCGVLVTNSIYPFPTERRVDYISYYNSQTGEPITEPIVEPELSLRLRQNIWMIRLVSIIVIFFIAFNCIYAIHCKKVKNQEDKKRIMEENPTLRDAIKKIESSTLPQDMKKRTIEKVMEQRKKESWEGERLVENRKIEIRTLKENSNQYLEISSESDKKYDMAIGFRHNSIGTFNYAFLGKPLGLKDDPVFNFWPFIDSPLSDRSETVWKKDIQEVSKPSNRCFDPYMIFSNKPGKARKLLMKMVDCPQDVELFYLSQDSYFVYYRITKEIDQKSIDKYIEMFTSMIKEIERKY